MWGNQQNTLPTTWRTNGQRRSNPNVGETSSKLGRGAGRARGRGKSASGDPCSSSTRGRKTVSGRGRGRGRGKSAKFMDSSTYTVDEDDDELCQQALGQYELANSDISKAFADSRSLTEIPGFDGSAGDVWIYPTNRPVRDYQFNITQTSLFHNTLVCLPTGLGKTFIAAVVMYNFHRWYPNDLIIFMAPTRPLVTQQLDACHNIVGIDPNKTVELTGQILPTKREAIWEDKKVFFLTPQVIQSDIARNSCPAERIRCVVIDEAHKALGNHSYGQVIAAIFNVNKHFRVVGLSATPGNDLIAIQQVFRNLLISKVELRSDSSPDILPYIHDKEVETIVVTLDPFLQNIYAKVQELYQIYTGKLMKKKILPYNGSTFVAFQLLQARQRFRMTMATNMSSYEKGLIEITFSICVSLSRAIDLLQYHGLRSFYLFFQGLLLREKGNAAVAAELKRQGIEEILESIKNRLNICFQNSSFNISTSTLFDSISEEPDNSFHDQKSTNIDDYLLSHPKLITLKDIVETHFKSNNKNTRIMIFSQYRDSVQEIGNMVGLIPNVRPMVFMGQAKTSGAGGRGLKQKEQVQVVQKFRNGEFNVLVATSVGEEGLDIGEVDLIICFDSSKSPTRNIQRMGRTGRQRQGRIIFLLTEGKEEKTYKSSVYKQTSVTKNITDPDKLSPFLFDVSPRMIPTGIDPQCFKMNIILSSEQSILADKRVPASPYELSTFDESDFLRPSKAQKQDKKIGRKGQLTRAKPSSSESSSPKNTNTLQKFVERMEIKKMLATKSSRASVVETITLEDSMDVPDEEYQYGHSPLGHGTVYAGDHEREEYEVMRSIFDLHDLDANSVAPSCVYIPKLDPPAGWISSSKRISDDLELLSLSRIQCLHEQVDSSIYLVDDRFCKCGFINIGSSPHEFTPPFDNAISSSANSNAILLNNQKNIVHSFASGVSSGALGAYVGRTDFDRISPNQWEVWQELPDETNGNKVIAEPEQNDNDFNLDDGYMFEDDWELEESLLHNNNSKNSKTEDHNTDPTELEKNLSVGAEGDRIYSKRVLSDKNQSFMDTNKSKSNINHPDSEDSTASESEWKTQGKFEHHYKSVTSATDKILSIPKFLKSPSCVTNLLPTSLCAERPVDPADEHSQDHSGIQPDSCGSKSPDISFRKKFMFKKKRSPIKFVTSFHCPAFDHILDSTFQSAKAETANVEHQPSETSRFLYQQKRPNPKILLSPAESDIDCIPGTSSEDEETASAATNLPNKVFLIPQKTNESSDTDATQWDPEEKEDFPSPIRLSETVTSPRFNTAPSFSSVRKEPEVSHLNSQVVCSPTKLTEVPKSNKSSPKSMNQQTPESPLSAAFRLREGVQITNHCRTSTPLHSRTTLILGDENSEPDLSRTPKRCLVSGQGSFPGRKSCLSRDSRNLLKTLSSSSATFSSDTPMEQPKPGTSASKPKFQFRRKQETSVTNDAASGEFLESCSETCRGKKLPVSRNQTYEAFDSDDDCLFLCEKEPSPSPVREQIPMKSFSESPDDVIVRRKNHVKRRIIRSTERPEPTPRTAPKSQSKQKKKKKNPFLWDEAVDASGSDSGGDEVDLGEDLQSFVVDEDEDDEDDCVVSSSQQQAMYMQSVKDVAPLKRGRVEVPIPRCIEEDEEQYDLDDSFCTNDVEYMDVGVFTQCMIQAREEVEMERSTGKTTRKLRSRKK